MTNAGCDQHVAPCTLRAIGVIVDVIEVSDDLCIACDNNPGAPAHVRAYVYVKYPSGLTAAFCAHHGREHRDMLIGQGATILDLSHLVHA